LKQSEYKVVDTFLATSAKTIAQYFKNHINADYAYVVMAKLLVDKAPFFLYMHLWYG